MPTCLWLARTIPFPLISGDRVYSARLAEAFAATGVAITFVGLVGDSPPESFSNIEWHTVPGRPRGRVVSLLSTLPLVGARHSTPLYKAELRRLLRLRSWDIIVVDQYGMGWVLAYRRLFRPGSCILVFVSHDHEESVTRQQWQDARSGPWEHLYLLQNYLKTRRSERGTAQACDLITVNTDADAALFRQTAPDARIVTLTPGYGGPRMPHRQISASTPRAAVMFGSYRWSVKQLNLRHFLDYAGARMHQAGIEMRIVGDIPTDLRLALERQYVAARFTGFVHDPAPYLDVRIAILAETIGGGFKHKLLDYIFNRIPIIALESCVVGLPDSVRRYVLTFPDLPTLMDCVETVIDDIDRLNALQSGAFDAVGHAFDWAERGKAMYAAVQAIADRKTSCEPS